MCRPTSQRAQTRVATRAAATESANPANPSTDYPRSKDELWYIHGRAYDLTRFASRHPGGLRNLMLGRGRDCTEIFESVHATGDLAKARLILSKYHVKSCDPLAPAPTFTFAETGLYATLVKDVKTHLETHGLSAKGNTGYWWRIALQLALHFYFMHAWVVDGSVFGSALSAFLAVSIGFTLFHTASHSGVSHDWRVNDFWTYVWGDVLLGFFRPMWLLHHVYGHHAHTGVHGKDPDINNAMPVARKSPKQRYKARYAYQHVTNYLLYLVFPGQWLGNVIQYARSMILVHLESPRARIFGLPIRKGETRISELVPFAALAAAVITTVFAWHGFARACVTLAVHSAVRSLCYFAIVFPNHETDLVEHSGNASDWGEQQITHSANFYLPGWVNYLAGGMNYQTEHHLFPAVHHEHYPAISRIVRKRCAEFGVRYNYHTSWFDALRGNFSLHRALSREDGGWTAHKVVVKN